MTSTTLSDFLNHGTMPFVGRAAELQAIREFRQGTIEATLLRLLLITGEAGVGKSRLLEQALHHTEQDGGIVVHCKLRPGSTTTPLPLLAFGLENATPASRLLRQPITPELNSIATALRRLSRLRPTLLVFEDVHLLNEEGVREFALLLQLLAEDPIALLCTRRPLAEQFRSIVEPVIVKEIWLEGLKEKEIGELSQFLLGSAKNPEAILLLKQVTLGNPLALRSALRGALNRATIIANEGKGWGVNMQFASVIRQSATSLSEGLAVHLTTAERECAERLALLGEVVTTEGARYLLGDDADYMIQTLLYKGILVRSLLGGTPLIRGNESAFPLLSFTHTLVHHHLLSKAEAKINQSVLMALIVEQPPLYSTTPFAVFQRLLQHPLPTNGISQVFRTILDIALSLGNTPEWKQGLWLHEIATLLFSHLPEEYDDHQEFELLLHYYYLELSTREVMQKEYMARLHRFLSAAENLPDNLIQFRLYALNHKYYTLIYQLQDSEELSQCSTKIDDLIIKHPNLCFDIVFCRTIDNKLLHGKIYHNYLMLEKLEKELERLITNTSLPDDIRTYIEQKLRQEFLSIIRSPEELTKRIEQVKKIDDHFHFTNPELRYEWLFTKRIFYVLTGFFIPLLQTLREASKQAKRINLENDLFVQELDILKCRMSLGFPLNKVEQENKSLAEREERGPASGSWYAHVSSCALIAIMRGQHQWAATWYRDNHPTDFLDASRTPSLLILYSQNPIAYIAQLQNYHISASKLCAVIIKTLDDDFSDQVTVRIKQLLDKPMLTFTSFIDNRMILRAFWIQQSRSFNKGVVQKFALDNVLTAMLVWLQERNLWPFMDALIDEFGSWLPEHQLSIWRTTATSIRSNHTDLIELDVRDNNRIHITLFDVISAEVPGIEEPIKPRGERLKTLIGIMVATMMMPRKLDRDEFLRIASGTNDPKNARDIVNNGISRLRVLLGNANAILTDKITPYFNPEVITVDILESRKYLLVARNELRSSALLRAFPAIQRALDLWHGSVPFPTLYDELFENLRAEFEVEMRTVSLQIASRLIEEGDVENGKELLRTVRMYMPED